MIFIGIDLGTSSVKTALFSENGRMLAKASEEYDISAPRIGWAEQDADAFWAACAHTIQKALQGFSADDVAGIGLSGQMHGLVSVNRQGRPVRPIIIWADQRSLQEAEALRALNVSDIALNPAATGFLLPSLMWVRAHEPDIFDQIDRVMLPKDYLRLRLTGCIGTERTDASGTLAYDPIKDQWSDTILREAGIPVSMLPELHHSCEIAGAITPEAAAETGLSAGTPVAFGGGDGPMQLTGNGVTRPGMLISNIGTASQLDLIVNVPLIDPQHRIQVFCHAPEGRFIAMGASLNGGGTLKWLRRLLFDDAVSYKAMDELAAAIPAGSENLLALPYLCGERSPHMDPHARGLFSGFTLSHTRAHMVRAVMEGVIFSLRDSLEVFSALTDAASDTLLASGGGAKSALWRQLQADIFKKAIVTTETAEEACLGAAFTAMVAVGQLKDLDEAAAMIKQSPVVTEPNAQNFAAYDEAFGHFQELYRCNRALFRQMAE